MISWPDPSTSKGRIKSYSIMAAISMLVSATISLVLVTLVAAILAANGLIAINAASLLILFAIASCFNLLIAKRVDKAMFTKRTRQIHQTPCRDCK